MGIKNIFLHESIYAMAIDKFLYLFIFFREIVMPTRQPGGNGNFFPGKKLPGKKLLLLGKKLPFTVWPQPILKKVRSW